MHLMVSVFTAAAVLGLVVVQAAANELTNPLDALEVETARININPWGANLGFDLEVSFTRILRRGREPDDGRQRMMW